MRGCSCSNLLGAGGGGGAAFSSYFWLDPKVTKGQGLNRLGYSGRMRSCRSPNSLRSDKGYSGRSAFALRFTPIRLCPFKKASLSVGMADADSFLGWAGLRRILYMQGKLFLVSFIFC